jgi:uncharacterized membrane protein YraQ (UPF0718 family)
MKEWAKLAALAGVWAVCVWVPFSDPTLRGAALEAFLLLKDYAREHVLLCLVPAFFIAGAISVFLGKGAVMRYLGAGAKRITAYAVASISGGVLAVCSCTVLPLFAGIYSRGAGLGPATAFLYSGPAINVLAVILTAQVLGWRLGLARAIGAVLFAVLVGLVMALLFRRDEKARAAVPVEDAEDGVPVYRGVVFLGALVAVLILATRFHWSYGLAMAGLVVVLAYRWFDRDQREIWVSETWMYAKMILPLLFAGVLVAGFLLGRPGTDAGLIPGRFVAGLVGGNSVFANLVASVSGALMYFATLTEVPILQGLMGQGMGEGPALALLLAGPAVSLPNLLVIRSVIGTKKALAYAAVVVALSTLAGWFYGAIVSW